MADERPEQTEGKAGENVDMTPMNQAQAGATGGQPAATPPDETPYGKEHMDVAHAIGQQQGAKQGFDAGQKQGFMDHPFESMFNLLAGGDQKLVGYRTSDDPDVKSGAQKVGSPIMQPRSKTEKWGAILAGALAGASKGYGPGSGGAALEAGMKTGVGIKEKEKTEAGEQYKRQTEAKREDIQNSLYTAELAQRHALLADTQGKHAASLVEADAATKSAFDLNGVRPEVTVSEDKMKEQTDKNPELLHKYMPIAIGVDTSDPTHPQTKYGFYRSDMIGDVKATEEMKKRWVDAGISGAENIQVGQDVNVKTLLNFETQRHAKDNETLRADDMEKHKAELIRLQQANTVGGKQLQKIGLEIADMTKDAKNRDEAEGAARGWQKSVEANPTDPDAALKHFKENDPKNYSVMQRLETESLLKKEGTPFFTEGGGTGRDPFGDKPSQALNTKEFNKRADTFSKDHIKDLQQLEQAADQMNGIIANAKKTGKLPGADSVVGVFDAIGISSAPLKGRGFRINKDIVKEHIGARNIIQDAAVKLQKLTPEGTGQIITLKQLEDYTRILNDSRRSAYVNSSNEATRQGLPKDFLPRGNGKHMDAETMKIYLEVAGGDANKAAAAAEKMGWR